MTKEYAAKCGQRHVVGPEFPQGERKRQKISPRPAGERPAPSSFAGTGEGAPIPWLPVTIAASPDG
jgi:hypothetical protein